ncbi:hypothetical protein Dda_2454 [Drechslerella dactyloides]|uniref:Uncharacterized protein n=1 Tax=Drechslerella dactyloides TaxID=74499 RepID=A0AAD6NJC1_DREDA|nr:hypothetical protein Dda_2454 [Drechslerella dactyloides]
MRAGTRVSTTLCYATTLRRAVPQCPAVRSRYQSTSSEGHTSAGTDSISPDVPISGDGASTASRRGSGSSSKRGGSKKSGIKLSENRQKWPIFRPWSMPMGSNTAWLKQYMEESGVEPTLEHYRLFQKKSNIYRIPLTRQEFDDIVTGVDLSGVPNWTTSALQSKRKNIERLREEGLIERKPYILRITGAEEYIDELDSSMDSSLTLEKRYTNDEIDYEALFDCMIELDPTYIARAFRNPQLRRLRLSYVHNMVKLAFQEGTLGANKDGSVFIGQEAFKVKLLAAGVDHHFLKFYKANATTREIDFDFEKANEVLAQYEEKGLDSLPGDPALKTGTMSTALPSRSPLDNQMKSERLLQNSDVTQERIKLTQKIWSVLDPSRVPIDEVPAALTVDTVLRDEEEGTGALKTDGETVPEGESLPSAGSKDAQGPSSLIGVFEILNKSISSGEAAPAPSPRMEDEIPVTGTLEIEPTEPSLISSSPPAEPPITNTLEELGSQPPRSELLASSPSAETHLTGDLSTEERPSEERDGAIEDLQKASAELVPETSAEPGLQSEPPILAAVDQETPVDTTPKIEESQLAPPLEPQSHIESEAPQARSAQSKQAASTAPPPPPPIDDGYEYLRQTMMASQQEKSKEREKDKKESEDDDSDFYLDEEDFDDFQPPPTKPRRPF